MNKINVFGFDVEIVDGVPQDTMFLLPRFQLTVPRPPGLSDLEYDALCIEMLSTEMIAAAKRGEVGMIKGVKVE